MSADVPMRVWVAIRFHGTEQDAPLIFSTAERAKEWQAGVSGAVVIFPRVIDHPDISEMVLQ